MRLDLHVHSVHSPDGRLAVAEIAEAAESAGLDGFALTDHNSIAGHGALAEVAKARPDRIYLPGVEVSTREGHLLLFGVRALPPVGRPIPETLSWARSHGAVAVLPHPFRWTHGVGGTVAGTVPVDAIEIRNGHDLPRADARAGAVARARRLGRTGGSDAHLGHEVGRSVTVFPEAVRSVDAALQAIADGRTEAAGRSARPWEALRIRGRSALLRGGRGFRSI